MFKTVATALLLISSPIGFEGIRVESWELRHADKLCNDKGGIDYLIVRRVHNTVTCDNGITLKMDINIQEAETLKGDAMTH